MMIMMSPWIFPIYKGYKQDKYTKLSSKFEDLPIIHKKSHFSIQIPKYMTFEYMNVKSNQKA